jgi:hypothetical protein
LPGLDYSLLVTLPKLIGPELQRLRESIERDDPEWGWDALTAVHKQIDTPQQRARLTDAIIQLRDHGRIHRRQAAYALLDLSTRSTRLVAASLLEAVAVSVASAAHPAASTSPPNPDRLSGGSSWRVPAGDQRHAERDRHRSLYAAGKRSGGTADRLTPRVRGASSCARSLAWVGCSVA